jgi:ACDE family multidrug resistance protein
MHERRIPEWLRHAPTPGVRGFAVLAGFESIARGILISVFPLIMYEALQDVKLISGIYFRIGLVSLVVGLMVPWVTRFVPRRWVYTVGACLYISGSLVAIHGSPASIIAAATLTTIAVVITFVCFNAYVLDFISKSDLGKCETSRMLYSALGWSVGPVVGVLLYAWWPALPFFIAATASFCMLVAFWYLRLGNGKLITRARAAAPNPAAFLFRFFRQPRLVAGWLFAVIRSSGWWIYIIYLPIFAIESGLSPQLGGICISITNGLLFTSPLILRWMMRRSLRQSVLIGFGLSGVLFCAATLVSGWPYLTIAALMLGSFTLIVLDVCAGLPFLMAVKPSERTEMSAVYSSFRDVSGIATPGMAWLVLSVAPLSAIFMAGGFAMFAAWGIATRMHPRLGRARIAIEPAPGVA